ncbi:MAG: prolipoprotein diacylglyceryl transferase [Candidatus Omnitrophica bacterium]|nr:prolipoprotein diacylglyceryl transferase [Candidatus Omnitrophota bacterium]
MHPIILKCGALTVYSYGVMIALACVIATFLMWKTSHLAGVPREKIPDFMVVIMIAGIIGARVLHVAVNADFYRANPLEIFMLTKGGLAFYGGLASACIAGIVYLRMNRISVWSAGDLLAPYLALGQAVGRMGCFLNGCCFGVPAGDFPLAACFEDGIPRYPTQLYEAVLLLAIYAVLRVMLQKKTGHGYLFILYVFLYTCGRFFIEYLRGDVDRLACGLTMAQVLSAAIALAAVVIAVGKRVLWKTSNS